MATDEAVDLPGQKEFHNPTLRALKNLGGTGTIAEIVDEVANLMRLSPAQRGIPHKKDHFQYRNRTKWSLHRLLKIGMLSRPQRGVYALTEKGEASVHTNPQDIEYEFSQQKMKAAKASNTFDTQRNAQHESSGQHETSFPTETDLQMQVMPKQPLRVKNCLELPLLSDESPQYKVWREVLHDILLGMEPAAFEKLFQKMLRESGFTQVDVTGRSGDGGIDGIGIVRIGGFLSFRVFFQCKRYKGSVDAGTVRDFRGAMIGRTDKGLIVTTGSFTPAALREATRDGAPEIDLIDGEQLIDKLAELELGVSKEMVPAYTVHPDFFANI